MARQFERCAVLCAAGLLALTTGAALAQQPTGQDAIAARQKLMKQQGAQVKTLVGMVRGKIPYDGAKASAAFRVIAETSSRIPSLFPDDSKSGDDTKALPKIWEDKADFAAKAKTLHDDAVANEKKAGQDLASLKAAFASIGNDCNACHKVYRQADE